MKTCYFCRTLIQGRAERHHIIPRRYHKRGDNHRRNNLAWAHTTCHRRFHHELDNPRLSREGYLRAFESMALGEGVFDGD